MKRRLLPHLSVAAAVTGLLFCAGLTPVRAAPAETAAAKTRINPKDGAEMAFIPAGRYVADNIHHKTPRPAHLNAYYIYKNLVSIAQYRRFCAETGRKMPPQPDWKATTGLRLHPPAWGEDEAKTPV